MRHLIPFALSVLVLTHVAEARAQAPAIGARVRVTSPLGRSVGVLERLTADTVVVAGRPIARASIGRIEVSGGRKPHWLAGMGIGLVGGAAAGFAVASLATAGSSYGTCHADEDNLCPIFTGLGAGAGLLLGAAIGGLARSDRWQNIPLSTLQIAPSVRLDGALGVSMQLRF